MPKRYLSSNQLVFCVSGRPLCGGKAGIAMSGEIGEDGKIKRGLQGGRGVYANLIRLSAKMAMAEQGWRITDKGVYVIITIYLGLGSLARTPAEKKRAFNNEIPACREPAARRIAEIIIRDLTGLVYEKEAQVVGILVVKKYDRDERVDVLVGTVGNFKELVNDLRNA